MFKSKNLFRSAARVLLFALAFGSAEEAATAAVDKVYTPPPTVFVRPGGTSYRWKFGTGTTPAPQYPGTYPVTAVAYYNVTNFGWILTRGHFDYSANGGASWTTYAISGDPIYLANPANIWRFVDTKPNDFVNNNSFGFGWTLQGPPGNVGSGGTIIPDNPPTDITLDHAVPTIFSSTLPGDTISTLIPTDTGANVGGSWILESQSVPNLFTLGFDTSVNNTAALKLGTGTMPASGQTASVTVRYFDLYQTDTNGVPIPGQGFSKTFTFTIIAESTTDLNFGTNLFVNTFTNYDQSHSAITKLTDGNFVVVWQSAGQNKTNDNYHGIYGQRFTGLGAKIGGEFLISNAGTNVDEITPTVTPVANARFAVAYGTMSSTYYNIGLRVVETNNTVSAQTIANTTLTDGNHFNPVATTLSSGNIELIWSSDSGAVTVRGFTTNGIATGAETVLATGTGYVPGICALSNGSFAISYVDWNTYEVYVKVGTAGLPVDTGVLWSGYGPPCLTGLANGFAFTSENSGDNSEIVLGIFNNAGALQGSLLPVNTGTVGNRFGPSIARLSDGSFVVAWYSTSDDFDLDGIFGRRFAANGTAVDTADFEINQHRKGDQALPAVTGLDNGLFATSWTDGQAPDFLGNIQARVLLPVAAPAPVINSALSAGGTFGTVITSYAITALNSPTSFGANNLPPGLSVDSAAGTISGTPSAAGVYNVTIGATNSTDFGTATLVFTIAKAGASVTLSALSQNYDGTGKGAAVLTAPVGLTMNLTYDGAASEPTNTGNHTVVAVITDANYVGASTNTLVINPAPLTVVADNKGRAFGETNPIFSGTITGVMAGDNLTGAFSTVAGQYSGSGMYVITAGVNDPDGKLGNYTVAATDGILVITPLPLVLAIEAISTNAPPIDPDASIPTDWARVTSVGEPNQFYDILVSTNLFDWSLLTTVRTDGHGVLDFLDDNVQTNTTRYFRARVQ